jgi:hypothetical protein
MTFLVPSYESLSPEDKTIFDDYEERLTYFNYIIFFNDQNKKVLLKKDWREVHFFGGVIKSEAADKFVRYSQLVMNTISEEEKRAAKERLMTSKGPYFEQELPDNEVKQLVYEGRLLRYLKKKFVEFETNRAKYRMSTCGHCRVLGSVSRALLVGRLSDLKCLCEQHQWTSQQEFVVDQTASQFGTVFSRRVQYVNDPANAFLVMPMEVFNNAEEQAENYVVEHPVVQYLKHHVYNDEEIPVNTSNLHYAQKQFRHFKELGENSFWADTSDKKKKKKCGVMVALYCYHDCIDVNIPGGKRELDETPLQTALRETSEETGLVLSDAVPLDTKRGKETYKWNLTFNETFPVDTDSKKTNKKCDVKHDTHVFFLAPEDHVDYVRQQVALGGAQSF